MRILCILNTFGSKLVISTTGDIESNAVAISQDLPRHTRKARSKRGVCGLGKSNSPPRSRLLVWGRFELLWEERQVAKADGSPAKNAAFGYCVSRRVWRPKIELRYFQCRQL